LPELELCNTAQAVKLSRRMTTANKITIIRILLVPFFVVQVLYYANTGNEWYRLVRPALLCRGGN
jgi:phosphatidylglycerophosphate synthase